MGIFSRRPAEDTTTVEGVITRIGIASHMEDRTTYGLHLAGVPGMFLVRDRLGKNERANVWDTNPHIAMASIGDRVRFGVKGSEPRAIVDFFENTTYSEEVG